MKKTKIKRRINNAVNAFFDDAPETLGETDLVLASDAALLKPETAAQINEKGDRLIKILKRTFLFLPGALYLFFGTLTIVSFDFLWNPASALIIFSIGSFLTIFGLGSLKNPKHLMIPSSIVLVALTTFWLFSTIGGLKFVFEYGVYLFPLALIVPILVKSLSDEKK
jgi:hypothetical protein